MSGDDDDHAAAGVLGAPWTAAREANVRARVDALHVGTAEAPKVRAAPSPPAVSRRAFAGNQFTLAAFDALVAGGYVTDADGLDGPAPGSTVTVGIGPYSPGLRGAVAQVSAEGYETDPLATVWAPTDAEAWSALDRALADLERNARHARALVRARLAGAT